MSLRKLLFLSSAATLASFAQQDRFTASLSGYQEVPAISTAATGRVRIDVNSSNTALTYELDYSGLQGPVTMARVYFAQPGVNGGLLFWLCGTPAVLPPPGTPVCPQSGRVTGSLAANHLIGSPAQGIQGAEFAKMLRALRAGMTYVNLHTGVFPGGELRAQLPVQNNGRPFGDDDQDDDRGRGRDRDRF